ncbi:MAG: hypothetical protein QXT64_08355 [Desulfurococcaceae archaeon]
MIRYICGKCGFVLYESRCAVEPEKIIAMYDGVCPRCGKKLENPANNWKINIRVVRKNTVPRSR